MNSILSTDVFSYDEDDMVEDPYLAKHLAHFGINVAALEKVGTIISSTSSLTLLSVQCLFLSCFLPYFVLF